MNRKVVLACVAVLVVALTALWGCADKPTSTEDGLLEGVKAQTAQSIMIDIEGGGDFVVEGNQVWHFDQDCGANYFNATGGNAQQQENAKKNFAQQQRCKFWNGSGDLVGGTQGPVTVTVANQPTTPKTCWYLHQSSGGGNVDVCLDITIAGESFVLSRNFQPNGKYSFTMRNPDGSSRILNLRVTLSGDASSVDYPTHTIVDGDATLNNCLLDFLYFGNAGTNGTIKSKLHAPGYLPAATMGAILNSDSFLPNNNGCPYTSIATAQQCYSLGPGSYTVTVTGTVKGNDGSANLSFTGTSQVNISAEGCQ